MKKKVMIVVGLSILLSTWSIFTYASRIHANEPDRLKTATLRVEGMT